MTRISRSVTEVLYKEMSRSLKYFIENRIKNPSDADDILHDVFVKIHNKIDTLKSPERMESWVFQITRNSIIDYYRKDKTHVELAEEPVEFVGYEEDMHKKASEGLSERISQLPEIYRQAMALTVYEGLNQKQLSERLNISLTGAKSRVQRARKMLKDMLLECCHFDFDKYGTVIDFHEKCCCCCPTKKM